MLRPCELAAHNAAVWKHGLLVHVPKGVVVEKPLYVRIASSVEGSALFWRLLVVADEQAEFTLIEEYSSSGPEVAAYSNAVAELFVASSESDAALFVYLSEVESDGTERYVTEGLLRALHRKESPAPVTYRATWPFRSFQIVV